MQKKGFKLELALMDDIKAAIGNYKSLNTQYENANKKAFTSVKVWQDAVVAAYQNAQNAIKMIDELDAKAKELGLPESGMSGYKKELVLRVGIWKRVISQIDGILSQM